MIVSTFVQELPFKVNYIQACQYKDMLNFYNRLNWRIPICDELLKIPLSSATLSSQGHGNKVEAHSRYHIELIDIMAKANLVLVHD